MKFAFSFFIFFLLYSCQQIVDNGFDREQEANYTSPYMGKWVGTYQGQESGNITINVSKSGSIFGTYGQNSELAVSYVLDDGVLLPVNSEDIMFILYGSLINKKGTWKRGNLQGTWTLTKQ